jgi:hypothetical protein
MDSIEIESSGIQSSADSPIIDRLSEASDALSWEMQRISILGTEKILDRA